MNLREAEAFLRAGDLERARDHLSLAESQAEDSLLLAEIRRIQEQSVADQKEVPPSSKAATDCSSGCGPGCAPGADPLPAPTVESSGLDLDTRLELCLGGYPEDLTERYLGLDEELKGAILLAHGGEDEAAMKAFGCLSEELRDEHFYYERGLVAARMGESEAALADLQHCLQLFSAHPFAGDVLVSLLLSSGHHQQADDLLTQLAAAGYPEAFCCARRAFLETFRGNREIALSNAEKAFQAGNREGELLVLLGQLLERKGLLGEAERVFAMTGGAGGCGGGSGVPLALAEFWLRQGRELDRALDGFKAAWQKEPDNPLWMVRTAQAYLAKGWQKEGVALINRVLARQDVPESLLEEARKALEGN
ncbi:tetratricopeptide repeat protein [Desulfuromonas carbonis]